MSQTTLDIKEPGLNVLPPGVERHVVNAGGLTGLQIFPDDEIEIINEEGNQICEIICFDKDGKSELGILNQKENCKKSFIKELLKGKDESSLITNLQLKKRNLDINKSKSSILFDEQTPSGEKIKIKSKDKCYVIFAAPQNNMLVSEQNPSSDLTLFIKRYKIVNDKELSIIPDPIYEPNYEENIERQTAISFEVKEGDFIQVISPAGRQCSDFVAFDTKKLDKKVEKGLDWQTTRTFMGNTFPGPGLFSKFYDTDHEPLVEVIRDTVGKHDTFNLACTSKYYEDAGYFGHPNCSENLNNAMAKYGVQKQKGWQAINLFFNTSATGLNSVISDESYARPGDYVMFRALKDLTIGTTACPSDIDACNSWNPTDIFVRTYDKKKEFSKSFAFRMKTDSEKKLTRNSGFHEKTSKLTRNFIDARGFWLPNDYTKHGVVEEYNACREKAVLIDLSGQRPGGTVASLENLIRIQLLDQNGQELESETQQLDSSHISSQLLTVDITVAGPPQIPNLVVASQISLGLIYQGSVGAGHLTLSNDGSGSLSIDDIDVTTASSSLSLVGQIPTSLAAGAEVKIELEWNAESLGLIQEVIEITSNHQGTAKTKRQVAVVGRVVSLPVDSGSASTYCAFYF